MNLSPIHNDSIFRFNPIDVHYDYLLSNSFVQNQQRIDCNSQKMLSVCDTLATAPLLGEFKANTPSKMLRGPSLKRSTHESFFERSLHNTKTNGLNQYFPLILRSPSYASSFFPTFNGKASLDFIFFLLILWNHWCLCLCWSEKVNPNKKLSYANARK